MKLKISAVAAISMLAFAVGRTDAQAQSHVVELFTSQGCNS
ncbi:hypothetical protein [Fulvimarina sp. MAC8]